MYSNTISSERLEDGPRVEKFQLHVPTFDEITTVLEESLTTNFTDVKVSVVDCPDLSSQPFHLSAKGLCGNPRVVDIGGVAYLTPTPDLSKIYDLSRVPDWTDSKSTDTFVLGAAGGDNGGQISETMPNIFIDSSGRVQNGSKFCTVEENNNYKLRSSTNTFCRQLGNIYVCDGKPGKVIEVRASGRKPGSVDFIHCVHGALKTKYATEPVALGGVIQLVRGKAYIHVMPGFSTTPLTCIDEVKKWLQYFEMSAPLTAFGYMLSYDPGYKLRLEHFHCFSSHGDGGHFHHETTPDDVEFVAYFTVPEHGYRVDRWSGDRNNYD